MHLKLTSTEARVLLEAHTKIDHWNIQIFDPAHANPEPKSFNLCRLLSELGEMIHLKNTKRPDGNLFCVKIERIKHVRAEFRAANVKIGLVDAKQFIERIFPDANF